MRNPLADKRGHIIRPLRESERRVLERLKAGDTLTDQIAAAVGVYRKTAQDALMNLRFAGIARVSNGLATGGGRAYIYEWTGIEPVEPEAKPRQAAKTTPKPVPKPAPICTHGPIEVQALRNRTALEVAWAA